MWLSLLCRLHEDWLLYQNSSFPVPAPVLVMNGSLSLEDFRTYVREEMLDKIIPADLILKSPYYIKQCEGFSPKFKAWSNISGIDLIRNKNGEEYG